MEPINLSKSFCPCVWLFSTWVLWFCCPFQSNVLSTFQIRTIDRGIEIPHTGAFCGKTCLFATVYIHKECLCVPDLVWSDPEEIAGWAVSPRGAGYLFGGSVTQEVSLSPIERTN